VTDILKESYDAYRRLKEAQPSFYGGAYIEHDYLVIHTTSTSQAVADQAHRICGTHRIRLLPCDYPYSLLHSALEKIRNYLKGNKNQLQKVTAYGIDQKCNRVTVVYKDGFKTEIARFLDGLFPDKGIVKLEKGSTNELFATVRGSAPISSGVTASALTTSCFPAIKDGKAGLIISGHMTGGGAQLARFYRETTGVQNDGTNVFLGNETENSYFVDPTIRNPGGVRENIIADCAFVTLSGELEAKLSPVLVLSREPITGYALDPVVGMPTFSVSGRNNIQSSGECVFVDWDIPIEVPNAGLVVVERTFLCTNTGGAGTSGSPIFTRIGGRDFLSAQFTQELTGVG